MRNRASKEVFDYWVHLCAERLAPLRSEIDPMALRRFLPHLFIATTDAKGEIIFRLAGTRICELFGREFRGLAFNTIWLNRENPQPLEIVHNVIQYERPALLDVAAANGDQSHGYELLLLPVRSGDARSDRVLGALVPQRQAFPEASLPVTGLALATWTFLERDGSGPKPEADEDVARGAASRLRRLLGVASFGKPS